MIQIYYGNGKGKTTAAVGAAVRAVGAGFKVGFVQFLKNNKGNELKILKSLPHITVFDAPDSVPFYFQMSESEKKQYIITENNTFDEAVLRSHTFGMLVLDELLDAIDLSIIAEDKLINFIKNKPKNLELIITGHNISPHIAKLADYISKIVAEKHPYDNGINARAGIEF